MELQTWCPHLTSSTRPSTPSPPRYNPTIWTPRQHPSRSCHNSSGNIVQEFERGIHFLRWVFQYLHFMTKFIICREANLNISVPYIQSLGPNVIRMCLAQSGEFWLVNSVNIVFWLVDISDVNNPSSSAQLQLSLECLSFIGARSNLNNLNYFPSSNPQTFSKPRNAWVIDNQFILYSLKGSPSMYLSGEKSTLTKVLGITV